MKLGLLLALAALALVANARHHKAHHGHARQLEGLDGSFNPAFNGQYLNPMNPGSMLWGESYTMTVPMCMEPGSTLQPSPDEKQARDHYLLQEQGLLESSPDYDFSHDNRVVGKKPTFSCQGNHIRGQVCIFTYKFEYDGQGATHHPLSYTDIKGIFKNFIKKGYHQRAREARSIFSNANFGSLKCTQDDEHAHITCTYKCGGKERTAYLEWVQKYDTSCPPETCYDWIKNRAFERTREIEDVFAQSVETVSEKDETTGQQTIRHWDVLTLRKDLLVYHCGMAAPQKIWRDILFVGPFNLARRYCGTADPGEIMMFRMKIPAGKKFLAYTPNNIANLIAQQQAVPTGQISATTTIFETFAHRNARGSRGSLASWRSSVDEGTFHAPYLSNAAKDKLNVGKKWSMWRGSQTSSDINFMNFVAYGAIQDVGAIGWSSFVETHMEIVFSDARSMDVKSFPRETMSKATLKKLLAKSADE